MHAVASPAHAAAAYARPLRPAATMEMEASIDARQKKLLSASISALRPG
jgi:hypothetical protein